MLDNNLQIYDFDLRNVKELAFFFIKKSNKSEYVCESISHSSGPDSKIHISSLHTLCNYKKPQDFLHNLSIFQSHLLYGYGSISRSCVLDNNLHKDNPYTLGNYRLP